MQALVDFDEAQEAEREKQQVLSALKEAVGDVKKGRVSKIDTLWHPIDDWNYSYESI